MPHDAAAELSPPRQPDARPKPVPPDLVIFDCDGVLIDSEIVVCRLTGEEFARVGYAIDIDAVIARFAGRPEREMIAEVEAEWGQTVPPEFFTRLAARIEHAYAHELQIMPGIVALLDRARVPFCVASSSGPAKLRLGLETVGLLDRFAANVVSAAFVAHGKPAPDVFIYAAGWMRTPIERCLVIEDSVPGTRAAVAAGMRVVGFAGGRHCLPDHHRQLLEAGAEHVVHRFDQLEILFPDIF